MILVFLAEKLINEFHKERKWNWSWEVKERKTWLWTILSISQRYTGLLDLEFYTGN